MNDLTENCAYKGHARVAKIMNLFGPFTHRVRTNVWRKHKNDRSLKKFLALKICTNFDFVWRFLIKVSELNADVRKIKMELNKKRLFLKQFRINSASLEILCEFS